jgi:hypothetical protein
MPTTASPERLAVLDDIALSLTAHVVEQAIPHTEPGRLIDAINYPALGTQLGKEAVPADMTVREGRHILDRAHRVYVQNAARQTGALVHAEHALIPDGYDTEATREVLLASTGVARIFGAVSSEPRYIGYGRADSNDYRVLGELTHRWSRRRYLTFDAEAGRVTFTEDGKQLLKPHLGQEGHGCPALQMSVEGPDGSRINIFSAFATDGVHRYVNRFVRPRYHPRYTEARFIRQQ